MQGRRWTLNKESTDWMRSVAAVSLIVIHSLEYSSFPMGFVFELLRKCGFICVSVFFFLSGVGLTLSRGKEGYLKKFLLKRFFKLLMPLYIVEWLCLGINSANKLDLTGIWRALLFWRYVPFSWYVISISVVYLLFWISNAQLHSYFLFLSSLIGGCVVSYFCGIPEMYYKCCPALIIGCFFALLYQNERDFMEKYPSYVNLCMWGASIALYLSKYGNSLIKGCLISGAIALLCASSTYWIKCSHAIWQKLASVSYELYLIHGFVILRFSEFNRPMQIFECLFISIIGAYITNWLYQQSCRVINMVYNNVSKVV